MAFDVLRVLSTPEGGAYRSPQNLSKAQAEALLEAAYLATAANGNLSDPEVESFRALVPRIYTMAGENAKSPTNRELRDMLDRFDANMRHTDIPDRLRSLANVLDRPELRDLAYKLGFAISLCDLATDDDEADYLDALTDAFELEGRVDTLTAEVYAALDMGEDDEDEG
jgi:hypothetical protein